MKHWFKDQHFRSLLKNTSYLAMSRVVAAVCSLATLAIVTHALVSGVLMFGTLILITSYAKAASGIAKFQSWQLVVRYGGHGIAHDDPEDFKTATGFAFALDVVSGIAGMLLAVALLPFIASWVGISRTICGWRCSIAPRFQPWARRRPTACFELWTGSTSSAGRAR